MAKELDLAKFHRVYKESLPVNVERANAGAEKTFAKVGASVGMAAPQPLVAVAGLGLSFCDTWPNIRKAINQALKWSWLLPSSIRQWVPHVKAFLTAADATFIPMVCGAASEDKPAE